VEHELVQNHESSAAIFHDNFEDDDPRDCVFPVVGAPPVAQSVFGRAGIPDAQANMLRNSLLFRNVDKRLTDDEQVHVAFKRWDVNGDGLISKRDLTETLSRLAPDLAVTSVDRLIDFADINRDGFVDVQEFMTWLFN